MKKVIRIMCILGLITIMIIIYWFSSQTGSESGDLGEVVAHGLLKYKVFKLLFSMFPYRKIAHFVIYACLGWAALLTFFSFNVRLFGLMSWLLCVVYACTDEFHQLFVDGRGAMIKDVVIDSMGSLTGIIVAFIVISLVMKIWKKFHTKMAS